MSKKNETLKETFFKALESYKKKDFKNAQIICYKILSIDAYHFESISLLATLSAFQRNFSESVDFLKKAIEIKPKDLSTLHNLATAYQQLGKFENAINLYQEVLKIDPKHINAHYNLGMVYYKLKDLKKSKNYLKKTVDMQKNYALAFFSLANVHVDLKEYHDAVSCYQKAIDINPSIIGAHNNLGLVFRNLNDFDNAIRCYRKAIELKPDHASTHHNLGILLKEAGQFDKAIKSHQEAIKYEPENLAHWHFLGELKKDIFDIKLKNKVKQILSKEKNTENNIAYGNFLLAKFENKNNNYDKEMEFLINAHKRFFLSNKKKFDQAVKYCFDDVLQISKGAYVEKTNSKYDEVKPIFIIGVPRCGSTLVEKIVGSGKTPVYMGEETTIFENFINQKILEKQSLNLGNVEHIRKDLNQIYKVKGILSKKTNFTFTDKSLNNFFYLNIIKDIYPAAKVINCRRNVLSSIISIFQNNLAELAWAHDLDNIFKYFDNYFKIIEKYIKDNTDMFYDLNFEKLVNEPIEESKKLMKFCGLQWDKKCLEYYKRKDFVSKTASTIQVRKAIYKHPAGKYLPYKRLLVKYGKKYSWFN